MRLIDRFIPLGAAGSVLTTLLCCLPLTFFGAIGAASLGAAIRPLRWPLVAASVVLLAVGFLRFYGPARVCRRSGWLGAAILWMSAVVVVLVLVFPQPLAAAIADGGTPRRGGAQSLALTSISSLAEFKAKFNEAADRVRVVVVMAPTCSICLLGTTTVQRMLEDDPGANVKVLAVWMPVLLTDWSRPRQVVLRRLSDRRVEQFWDETRAVGGAIGASLDGTQSRPDCCDDDGVLWDVVAVYPKGELWEDRPPHAAYLSGPIVDSAISFQPGSARP